MAKIFDGKKLADTVKTKLRAEVEELERRVNEKPSLISILVGKDPASQLFLAIKERLAQEVRIEFGLKEFDAEADPAEVAGFIQEKNADKSVQGILIQLPLPECFDAQRLIRSVHPFKDVDCLHPKNIGALALNTPVFLPPVVLALQKLLKKEKVSLKGKKAAIVGRGRLVGLPVLLWLMHQKCGLSSYDEHSRDWAKQTKDADLLISGTGKPGLIGAMAVKRAAVVVDFGYANVKDKVVGDVAFKRVEKKAKLITPVPGGMGPLVAMGVLENTLLSFRRSLQRAGRLETKE